MSEENKELLRRWFEEVWNKGRADAIVEMFDENGIAHGLSDDPSKPIKGPTDFTPFHTTFRAAFPNMIINVDDMVAEGDKVAARCSVRGKHEGLDFDAQNRRIIRNRSKGQFNEPKRVCCSGFGHFGHAGPTRVRAGEETVCLSALRMQS